MNVNLFTKIDAFLATTFMFDTMLREVPKTGFWRVELLKHNRTSRYTLRTGFSGYNATEIKYYIRSKRIDVKGISEIYTEGDTFSILDIHFDTEELALDFCYDVAEHYRLDPLFVLPRHDPLFFKDLEPDLKDVIDGAVAGDGCITKMSSKSGMFLYQIGNKQLGHIEEMLSVLQSFGYRGEIKTYTAKHKETKEPYIFYSIHWALRCLLKHRERWYTAEGKKRLPLDVSNAPEFWRWFYAGDGCFQQVGAFSGQVTLCANDFSTEDVERLRLMLLEHGIESKKWAMRNQGTVEKPQWLIWMFSENARTFLKMISPAVKGLEYKWAMPEIPIYVCGFCKKEFKPYRADMKYCSSRCRDKGKPSRINKR